MASGIVHRQFGSAVEVVRARFDGWNGRSIGAIAHAAFMYETAARRLWAGDAGSNRAVRWSTPHWIELALAGQKAQLRIRIAIAEAKERGDLVAINALEACADQVDRSVEVVTRWGFDGLMAATSGEQPRA